MASLPAHIGLISDTHGLLRKSAVEALAGSELIVHAGDVGKPEILQELRRVAPVIAVRGNVDTHHWARSLPASELVEVLGAGLYVLHDLEDLDLDPAAVGLGIVVSGHTHKPVQFEKNGVLYLNPGSAGPRRFSLPITIVRLHVGERPWKVEFVDCREEPA